MTLDYRIDYAAIAAATITDPTRTPEARRFPYPHAQIYLIQNFLSPDFCRELIQAIDAQLVPSQTTSGEAGYRTSSTAYLNHIDLPLHDRLAALLDPLFANSSPYREPIQGQKYTPGQYFKHHNDWFDPNSSTYAEHTAQHGQRTWTAMAYLNTPTIGGHTFFHHPNHCFTPYQGTLLAWNNLLPDGTPNEAVRHEALPLVKGEKYVITCWYRERLS